MKFYFKLCMLLMISYIFISCNNDDDTPDPNVTYEATLNGANEVPANSSAATGTATLSFDTVTKVFTITVTHTIAAPTNGHIHKAAVGENGPPVFALTSFTSPINFTSDPLDAAQEADLNAGLYYVNIHTGDFPAGEIRGQLIKQ